MGLEYNISQLGIIYADLIGKSANCYEFLYEKDYIKKLENMNQLGIIQNTSFKTTHKRMEYIVLQIYLVNLLLGREFDLNQSKDKKKKFNLGLSKSKQINSYKVSGAEIIIMWILLFNAGHLNGTFAAEKGLLKYIKENNEIYTKFKNNMPQELKKNFEDCIINSDVYNLHKFLIVFSLNIHHKQCRNTKTKNFIRLLIKLIQIYFNCSNERYLKFKKYFNQIRRISYLYLDSQNAEFPVTFKIISLLLNLDKYVEELFDDTSFFNKTLNSVDKLVSHDLYYSQESISEFNFYVDNFYDFWKNNRFNENEIKNNIVSGCSLHLEKHITPKSLHLSIENSIKSKKWYENKFDIELENHLNNVPRENCQIAIENIRHLNFLIINMIFVSGNYYNHLISISKLTKKLVKINKEIIDENNLNNELINLIHEEFSDAFKEIIQFILNRIIKSHYFVFEDYYDNIQIIAPYNIENTIYLFQNVLENKMGKSKEYEKKLIKKFVDDLFYEGCTMLVSLSQIKGYLKETNELNVEIDGLIFMYKNQKLHLYLIESKNVQKGAHSKAKKDLNIKLDKLKLEEKVIDIKQEYSPKGIYYHLII